VLQLRNVLLAATGFLLGYPASAAGQHFDSGDGISELESGDTCTVCHENHGRQDSDHILRMGEGQQGYAIVDSRGSGPDAVARSCLRCHSTAQQRSAQAEFRNSGSTAMGKYLELDPSRNHPIGLVDPQSVDSSILSTWDDPDPTPTSQNLVALSSMEPVQLTCSRCHDPHDRASILPDAISVQALCAECHDAAVFTWGSHSTLVCTDCHKLHGGHTRSLVAEPSADELCRSCHDPSRLGRERELSVPPPLGHLEPPAESCGTCHPMHQ